MANRIRKNTFLIKRSNIPGNVPTSGQVLLGELALNTADVILYASGTTANSILPIGWDRIARTGDTMTGSLYLPFLSATTITANTISANTFSSNVINSGTTNLLDIFTPKGYDYIKNIIVVGKGGNVDFTTLSGALNSITASSMSNMYEIHVGPGIYIEPELDLTSKPYVSILGYAIETTIISAATPTQHMFKLGLFNELSFMTINGTGSGFAGIAMLDSGDYSQAHKVSFNNCDIGVLLTSVSQDTIFYGEYIDFNGEYSYGVKIIASNGFKAFANLENYYNFPIGTASTIGTYISGVGSDAHLLACGNLGNGFGTAVYIQDGAHIELLSVNNEVWNKGIHVGNVGVGSNILTKGIINEDNILYDLSVDHPNTTGSIFAVLDATKIFINPSCDISVVYQDPIAKDFTISGKLNLRYPNATITDISTAIAESSTSGVMEGGELSPASSGTGFTVNVAAGYGYLEQFPDQDVMQKVTWSATSITLSANTENYLYFNQNEILSAAGSRPDTFYNILLGRVVTNSNSIEFIDGSLLDAEHIGNRNSIFLREAVGPVYASGSIVTPNTATTFTLDATAGKYYFAENKFTPSGGTIINFEKFYRNGSGGWNKLPTNPVSDPNGITNSVFYYVNNSNFVVPLQYFTNADAIFFFGTGFGDGWYFTDGSKIFGTSISDSITVDNNLYDTGTGILHTLSGGYYTKHSLYVIGGVTEKYLLVFGQAQYSALTLVEQANISTPPSYFDEAVVLIASVIVKQGASGITETQDLRPVIGFKAPSVAAASFHGNLLGLANDDHKQYLLVDGSRAMAGNLSMGGNNIFSAGTVNGIIVEAHASRHLPNGADPIATGTPVNIGYINDGGIANTLIRSDHVHAHGSLSGGSLHSIVDSTNAGFMSSADKIYFDTIPSIFNTKASLSGATFTGQVNTPILSATTISATTYFGLPKDIYVTGGTFSTGIATFTNNTGGTFTVTGFTDTYVTAYTYNSNLFTIKQNAGQPDLSVLVNTMTGLTINGSLSATSISANTLNLFSAFTFTNTPNSNYVLTSDSGGTGTWQVNPSAGLKAFFFTTSNADIVGDFYQQISPSLATGQTITSLSVANGDILATFISVSGQPATTFLPAGLYSVYITAAKVFGVKAAKLYAEVYQYSSGGTETLLTTTNLTPFLSPSNSVYLLQGSLTTPVALLASDRIEVKIRASISGPGLSPNILLTVGDATLSRLEIPFNVPDTTTFISFDSYVTGGTANNSNKTYTFTNNTGGTFSVNALTDIRVTGGTYSNGTAVFTNNTGGTFNVNGFVTGDTYVTGGTYVSSAGTATFTNNTGGTFNVSNFFKPSDDIYTTGLTFNPANYNLTITRNDNVSFTQNLAILASDMTITGGTYNSSTGVATFYNNTGGTFNVTGFLTGMTDTTISSYTYNNNAFVIKDTTGGTFTAIINIMTGLTVNGNLNATTISATTYLNLPTDIRVTGGTFNGNNKSATFTNNTGGTFTVTGFTDTYVTGGTYNNGTAVFTNNTGGTFNVTGFLSADTFVTGFTYSNNLFTISRNQAQPNLNVLVNTMTGLTINGNLTVTGATTSYSLTATGITTTNLTGTTISATTISATTGVFGNSLKSKSGIVAGSSFAGNPKKATVTFTNAYPTSAYTITIAGGTSRTYTFESVTTTGFTINSNANPAFTTDVHWQTMKTGEEL